MQQLQIQQPYLMVLQLHPIPPFQQDHARDGGVLLNQDKHDGVASPTDVDNMHDGISYDVEDEW